MSCYYNEIDLYCAAWLRNLIDAGHLPAGDIDTRSIVEVKPDDLRGYTQAHFFAGIGGWPYALRLADWPDDAPVWTGSCPCQPFSTAGKRLGTADARHLWPEFHRLIAECRPATVFGEQVASKDGRQWLSGVRADLEALGYAAGCTDLCAASSGAPHIRQRLWWVGSLAHAAWATRQRAQRWGDEGPDSGRGGEIVRLAHLSTDGRLQERADGRGITGGGGSQGRSTGSGLCGASGQLAHHLSPRLEERPGQPGDAGSQRAATERGGDAGGMGHSQHSERRPEYQEHADAQGRNGSGGDGFWSRFDLIPCLDGKTRRIESGTFPLAHGVPARVGKLRAYGNAICAPLAAEFVRAFMEPAFTIGRQYILTEQYSSRSDSYEDRSYPATYVGLADDGCFAFDTGDAHGVHVFCADGHLWLDDMVTVPMIIEIPVAI